jgi:hypothetical protein
MDRGTKEAITSYRASLEKLDQEATEAPGDAGEVPKPKTNGKSLAKAAVPADHAVLTMAAKTIYGLNADRINTKGTVVQAAGHVVIHLANGVELRAQQVRVTAHGGQKEIVIEK